MQVFMHICIFVPHRCYQTRVAIPGCVHSIYCKQQLMYKGTESRQQTPSRIKDLIYQELKDGFCFHFRKKKTHCSRGSQKTKLL